MACVLSKEGSGFWSGAITKSVTIAIKADNTKLAAARYNGSDLPVIGDTTATFVIATGWDGLFLSLGGGVTEDVQVVEVCPDGTTTQTLYSYANDYEPDVNLWIKGV